ncbi:asparagine synthase (glutamine-hydrolyzing) [Acetobacter papayae]|uniref:asparagine synthase (glutamine-hydrolyzing) n=1 Tax=Acetobacter papayae TaxID=1076592 RepID=UPI000472E95D|nr:asparagine synthase (glutamine-hydrolyzing) [Acetobacter papayae]
MCGIAGLAHDAASPPCPLPVLEALAEALSHRGPDGAHIRRESGADLVHTRLSIIDLAGGDQPLSNSAATLIANGEIYNDPQIRQTLGPAAFTTGSDCESALALFTREGVEYPRHLRGMYAIALHDTGTGEVVLSRDPFGIKPLYMAETAYGLAFASEPAALLRAGLVQRTLCPTARETMLQLRFVPGEKTVFPGIRRVLPGETLRIINGHITARYRQPALPVTHRSDLLPRTQGNITEDRALALLDTALMNSVSAHERADVPFGLFLSGGIDSACVLTAMSRLKRAATHPTPPLHTWTASFDVPGAANEAEAARALAQTAGAEHETLMVTRAMVWRHLPEIVACMDDPATDYAIIPTWFLARRAAQDVRVILSGEGGDELFCGYGRYRAATRPWWAGRKRPWRRGVFDGLDILRADRPGADTDWRAGIAAAEQACAHAATPLARAQAVDIAEWLPNDLLLKLDRCLMAHGLEGRTPLLDPVVADVARRLPDNLRVHNGQGKWLLRRWLAQHAPAARPFAPKQGFTVPIGSWIAQDGQTLGALVAKQDCIAEIAHPEQVRALFMAADKTREGTAAWGLLFYALWHRAHVRAQPVTGDVFETLAV